MMEYAHFKRACETLAQRGYDWRYVIGCTSMQASVKGGRM